MQIVYILILVFAISSVFGGFIYSNLEYRSSQKRLEKWLSENEITKECEFTGTPERRKAA